MILAIPEDKRRKAINLLNQFIAKKKATIKELQTLSGYLNFLNKAIYPGRAFMRRMYSKYASIWNNKIDRKSRKKSVQGFRYKPYHHIKLDKEFKVDCKLWLTFLQAEDLRFVVNRPMLDISKFVTSADISFYSDTSVVKNLGYGCVFANRWLFGAWEENLIDNFKPSIEFLELFALCAGLFTWKESLSD